MTVPLLSSSVNRSGVVMNTHPFYEPISDEHYPFYKACREEFGHVFVAGEYAQYVAQREKSFQSYWMSIVFDIDDPENTWDKLYNHMRDPVAKHRF